MQSHFVTNMRLQKFSFHHTCFDVDVDKATSWIISKRQQWFRRAKYVVDNFSILLCNMTARFSFGNCIFCFSDINWTHLGNGLINDKKGFSKIFVVPARVYFKVSNKHERGSQIALFKENFCGEVVLIFSAIMLYNVITFLC